MQIQIYIIYMNFKNPRITYLNPRVKILRLLCIFLVSSINTWIDNTYSTWAACILYESVSILYKLKKNPEAHGVNVT